MSRGRQPGGIPSTPATWADKPAEVPPTEPGCILRAVVGSQAYGLARAHSDVDRLGVFVAPTVQVAGLDWSSNRETRTTSIPDSTLHEVGKYLRLALKCNPTVLELLFLPDAAFEVATEEGEQLKDMRDAFLSTHGVKSAYGGYARQQADRLRTRGDGSFSSDTRQRTTKHARHLLRLLRQGRMLLETGDLIVMVDDPKEYFAFDHMSVDEMLEVYAREDSLFADAAVSSVLPEEPDTAKVTSWLRQVRRTNLG